MSSFDIRAFRRADRDQLARLVNSHAAAVMPGASVSVNTVLSQLEREPDEFIVDPWVSERRTLVAEQSGAIVAAALMLRYRADTDVGETYRNAGEIRWLLFWPMAPADNPFWEDGHAAANAPHERLPRPVRHLACHPPSRRRCLAPSRCLRGPGPVAPH